MKKRMLITSIVMVVVLAVALTTSSLAWFSATQSTVTAESGEFTAATTKSGNVNIAISKSLSSFKDKVQLDRQTTTLIPVCLNSDLATLLNNASTIKFDTAKVQNEYFQPTSINQKTILLDTANGAVNSAESTDFYYYDSIYLVNYDATSALKKINITVSGSLTKGEGIDALATPVAIIRLTSRGISTDESWANQQYVVLCLDGSGNYTVCDLFTHKAENDDNMYSDTYLAASCKKETNYGINTVTYTAENGKFSSSISFDNVNLAAGGKGFAKIDILMWLDGNTLDATTQKMVTNFALEITGENETAGA